MLNKEKVTDYFRINIKEILNLQSPYTWCDDDSNRELLWQHEQDISDYRNSKKKYKGFVSQNALTLDEAVQAVEEIHNLLRSKWNLKLPFMETSYVSTIDDSSNNFLFGWSISYNFLTSIGIIKVSVKTMAGDIEVTIEDNIIGSKFKISHDFDLFKELEQLLIMNALQN